MLLPLLLAVNAVAAGAAAAGAGLACLARREHLPFNILVPLAAGVGLTLLPALWLILVLSFSS